ncbi:MAG TPA: GIY-YIG nuclease family protein [Pedobacter sp.]|nr:GIY-YIG nuclease family protein [Pedobacter sp.]
MQLQIQHISDKLDELVNSGTLTFQEVKNYKNIMGVYLIFDQLDQLMYVGSTNKFQVRFGTDLRHESTHTLMKKLIKQNIHIDRLTAQNHFSNHYTYKINICKDKREAEALEHLAIWILQPIYNK